MAEVNRSLTARRAGFFDRLRRSSPSPLWERYARAEDAARVRQHYDLGNDFYRLWLDRDTMQYTCAYYPEPGLCLEEAQRAKAHYLCRKLRLRPGETVVEAGCGWGGLAFLMARHYGVQVTAYNICKGELAMRAPASRRRDWRRRSRLSKTITGTSAAATMLSSPSVCWSTWENTVMPRSGT